jgi:hypothetical protein
MFALLLGGLLLGAEKAELIQAPSGSKSDNLEVQAGGLVLRDGEAGTAFGTVRAGKGKRQLSYFVVLRHHLGKAEKSDFNEEATADLAAGQSKQTLSLDGKSVEIVYKVAIDKEGKVTDESLTVSSSAGKKETHKDLKKSGRVLLVDLTGKEPTFEVRKGELPAEVEAPTKKAAEELAKKVLAKLAEDKKVKEFIDKSKN